MGRKYKKHQTTIKTHIAQTLFFTTTANDFSFSISFPSSLSTVTIVPVIETERGIEKDSEGER